MTSLPARPPALLPYQKKLDQFSLVCTGNPRHDITVHHEIRMRSPLRRTQLHSLLKTKCPFFIPRIKKKHRAFKRIFCVADWTSSFQCHSSCHPTLSDKAIFILSASEEQVLEVMKGVDISKACGYDGFMVIRLLNYAVRVFMFTFLLLLICIIHLVITRANESLQICYSSI